MEIQVVSKDKLDISSTNKTTVGSKEVSITGGSNVVIDGEEVNINS